MKHYGKDFTALVDGIREARRQNYSYREQPLMMPPADNYQGSGATSRHHSTSNNRNGSRQRQHPERKAPESFYQKSKRKMGEAYNYMFG